MRKNDVIYRMHGHADTVTGTELSPDGSYLLTTAMDNTGLFITCSLWACERFVIYSNLHPTHKVKFKNGLSQFVNIRSLKGMTERRRKEYQQINLLHNLQNS